jgi:hypothetical protein
MYLEILLKVKFGVHTELWSIVKRWYPILTQSFDVVCNNDGKFQRSDFTALFGEKCLYIWDHKMDHLWLCYITVKRWARDSTFLWKIAKHHAKPNSFTDIMDPLADWSTSWRVEKDICLEWELERKSNSEVLHVIINELHQCLLFGYLCPLWLWDALFLCSPIPMFFETINGQHGQHLMRVGFGASSPECRWLYMQGVHV